MKYYQRIWPKLSNTARSFKIMKSQNLVTGRLAEKLAAERLIQKGFLIIERNFSNKFGEIDIIAKDKETIVFVEVKAKKGVSFGLPEEMVTKGKLQRIRNMAVFYLKDTVAPCRIDVVAIVFDENLQVTSTKHYENVY